MPADQKPMFVGVKPWLLLLLSCLLVACPGESSTGSSPLKDRDTTVTVEDPPVGSDVSLRSTESNSSSREGNTCRFEILWKFGEIDKRFGLSPTDIDRAMNRVQELWGGAIDEFHLTRTEDRGIEIDFHYDERQELIDGESVFRDRLREQEIRIEQHQRIYEEKHHAFEQANQALLKRSQEFQRDLDALNTWVREMNDGGRFTDEQIARYEREREQIEQRQRTGLATQSELQMLARDSNQAMADVNEAIDRWNEMIDQYNEIFAGQRLVTSGHYQRTNGRDTITIYQFQGETGLQRVLAHEIGHAIGLSHIANPEAIMFEIVSGHVTPFQLRLTADDRNALHQLCMEIQP
ncbi:MAG: matrixin family metalloprotease [Balneolaceae bacterium]